MKTPTLLLLLALATPLHAGPRTSANYSILTDTADAGGKRATSASYTNDGSVGGVGGVVGLSTVTSPAEVAKNGYIGQIYDVTGLTLNAASLNVNEGATVQLAAWQLLDDTSLLAVPAASVAWSVASGPLTGISASGIATAGIVYQNTAATAQGSYLGNTGTLGLTVVNVNPDNFGAYAGDGIDDAWQVQYFGQPPNANAGPTADFDHTGQTNLFKYIAGLNPLDGSRFTLSVAKVEGVPTRKDLKFDPVVAGRTYTVTSKADLNDPAWNVITVSPPTDNGTTRTVSDLNATQEIKFYRIEITKP